MDPVTAATLAMEAIRRLERTHPGVVICDIARPEYDGYWFVREFGP